MIRRAFGWACLLAVAASGFPSDARSQPPTAPAAVVRGISYRDNPRGDAAIAARCVVDLDRPVGTNRPVVVWFHGGGLTGGSRELPSGLRGKGLLVVGAGYRLSPGVRARTCVEDAAAAVAWTVRNCARYGGDPRRIVVAGHSAGGYLAAMVVLDKRWLAPYRIDPDTLAGLAPMSPQAITHFTVRKERGIADTMPVVDDMAPLHHVRKGAPPILIVTGDRELELLGRYEENAYFHRMLAVVGHRDVVLKELQGYDHGGMAAPAMPLLVKFVERVAAMQPIAGGGGR
ncbi:MAG: alpha/beta hydrolase [Armatimonadota bacterium]